MFPSKLSQETLRFSGNKIYCSTQDQSLSVDCFLNYNRKMGKLCTKQSALLDMLVLCQG